MTSWSQLPAPVQDIVFEALAQPDSEREPSHRNRGLSRYALVCKDWQPFFEEKLYSHIVLTQHSLSMLKALTVHQRKFVKHIWLRVELSSYRWRGDIGGEERSFYDHSFMGWAIEELVGILATWEQDRASCPESLTLEMSAHSVSDPDHFEDFYFDVSSWAQEVDSNRDGQTPTPLDVGGLGTLFTHTGYNSMQYPSTLGLPRVQMVRGFIWRRQTRRTLQHDVLANLVQAFPNLGFMCYEPWYYDPNYCDALSKLLPETVRELTLFGDFNEEYDTVIREYGNNFSAEVLSLCTPGRMRTPSPEIGTALAKRSLGLARLSASYIAEASDFFAARDPDWLWDRLVSLSLTSSLLVAGTSDEDVSRLLVDAGLAALQMPLLKTMDVWNGTKGNACAFQYEATDEHTTIRWLGTRPFVLDVDVISVWSQVARRHTRRILTVEHGHVMPTASIGSHAVAIQELGLGGRVVHPVSLQQISKETERYFFK